MHFSKTVSMIQLSAQFPETSVPLVISKPNSSTEKLLRIASGFQVTELTVFVTLAKQDNNTNKRPYLTMSKVLNLLVYSDLPSHSRIMQTGSQHTLKKRLTLKRLASS